MLVTSFRKDPFSDLTSSIAGQATSGFVADLDCRPRQTLKGIMLHPKHSKFSSGWDWDGGEEENSGTILNICRLRPVPTHLDAFLFV